MQTCFHPANIESKAAQPPIDTSERGQSDAAAHFGLFIDLGEWVSRSKLKAWIDLEVLEVHKLVWDTLDVDGIPHHPADWQVRMLALLSFAYATGVFSGEEIAERCHRDSMFQSLCGGVPPFAEEVWSFRRANRGLLREILARVFQHAVAERFGLEASLLPPELEQDLRERACERLDLARHMDANAFCE
jgi:hypothetical protein